MTTTITYTLNSQTASLLREGDVLTFSRTGEAYGVTTIMPCGRGYRITTLNLNHGMRPLYLEKMSTFYGFEFTHTEETPDPRSEVEASSAPADDPKPFCLYEVESVDEFEYTGGGIWVTCGYVREVTTGERRFFDGNLGENYVEYLTIFSEYPYETDDEDVEGCTFMPLDNFDELICDCFDPDSDEGRILWKQVIELGSPSVYRSTFLDALAQYYPKPESESSLTLDESVSIKRFAYGEGFFCDIEETADQFSAWLGHKDSVEKMYIFGVPKVQDGCNPPFTYDLDLFLEVVESNIPEYLDDFTEKYLYE